MKWEELKKYIDSTLSSAEKMSITTEQEQGFIYAFQDIEAKMDRLELENEE